MKQINLFESLACFNFSEVQSS